MLVSYSRTYELKLKDSAEEWKIKTNFKAWLSGIYIQNAIASVLAKGHSYPSKPFELHENKSDENSLKSSENAIKERSKIINQMVNKK